jgi:ferric-dicitrate binding protein FerR (iron transport regulator)
VPEKARQAYQEWKQADARAREVEARLARSWDEYFGNRGPAPSQELIQEVSRLRAIANDRLTAAMMAMGTPRRNDDTDPGRSRPQ